MAFGGDPMTDWFEWNGKKCTELGIHVSEHPPITLPAEHSTFTDVPGRSGNLTVLENEDVYDDTSGSMNRCIMVGSPTVSTSGSQTRIG